MTTGQDGDVCEGRALEGEVVRRNCGCRKKIRYGEKRYRDRDRVERYFWRIKDFRCVAKRYDKKAINSAGFV